MFQLEIGQQVWGYIGSNVTVCGTDYQEYGEVTRIGEQEYRAKKAGRADYTGFEDTYKTLQTAMKAARLPLDGKVTSVNETVFRIRTAFDKTKEQMNIRDLVGQSVEGLSVEGVEVSSISDSDVGYIVVLKNGDCLSAKGHDTIESLKLPQKPPSSNYRIRRYGEFGSTIN